MTKPSKRDAAKSSRRSRFSTSRGKGGIKWAVVGSGGEMSDSSLTSQGV